MPLHHLVALICLFPSVFGSIRELECPAIASAHLNSNRITALILARGGSKGIPLKNHVPINGEPLLIRSLRILLEFNRFASIWVSTDDDRIASTIEDRFSSDQVRIHLRPPVLDTTPSIESTQEFIRMHPEVTNVALIQCTSPFLKVRYLEELLEKFEPSTDCVFSVTRSYKLRWRRDASRRGAVVPVNFNPERRPRRQDWDGELLEAGMFYVARRDLLSKGRFQNDRCQVVEIEPGDALEIDTVEDLELARVMDDLRNKR
ncbi:hypothetical protein pipiens_007465 [Culex pipiens pipiens]|uniref:N-acylneuraminate cytidylyltransferase n=1 Tax=Culex pipiens pipiens TaxID=38569 RepID=A0ABD1DKY5_CULPP